VRSATGECSGIPVAHVLTTVPEIAAIFWVLKLLTTGMGEAMSDFLGQQSVPMRHRLLASSPQSDPCLLGGLHPHPAARGIVRGLVQQADQRRPEPR